MIHFNCCYYNILKDVINKFWIVHPQNHVGFLNGSMFFQQILPQIEWDFGMLVNLWCPW